jgi:hypothetical protein
MKAEVESVLGRDGADNPRKKLMSWRGDKTTLARIVLSEVPVAEWDGHLFAMARDEDDMIRWASLILCFDRGYQKELRRNVGERSADIVTDIVSTVVVKDATYFLHREFFDHLVSQHSVEDGLEGESKVRITDIPGAVEDLFRFEGYLHPEVEAAVKGYLLRKRRVLVLIADTETPGGSIGGCQFFAARHHEFSMLKEAVAAKGHYVEVGGCGVGDAVVVDERACHFDVVLLVADVVGLHEGANVCCCIRAKLADVVRRNGSRKRLGPADCRYVLCIRRAEDARDAIDVAPMITCACDDVIAYSKMEDLIEQIVRKIG